MKQLVLHIGTYRSGSTSLQAFFDANRERLLEQGWYYPEVIDRKGYMKFFENGNMWPLYSPVKHYEDLAVGSLKEMFQIHDRILISGEDFWGSNRKEIKLEKLCAALDADIKVIVYLRRQDKYLESVFNQWIKMGEKHYQHGNWRVNYEDWIHADYHGEIQKMEKVIGKDHILLRPMEKGDLKDGSVIPDFCGIFGIRMDESFEIPPRANASLNSSCLHVRNLCNAVIAKDIKQWYNSLGARMTSAFSETSEEMGLEIDRDALLSSEERTEILKEFGQGNSYLANRYFAREKLFNETWENREHPKKDFTSITAEDFEVFARVFSKIYIANEKRLEQLAQRIAMLEDRLKH